MPLWYSLLCRTVHWIHLVVIYCDEFTKILLFLTLWRPLLPYWYSWAERHSAQMSKITNDGLTWSGTGCFIALPIGQEQVSKCLSSWLMKGSEASTSLIISNVTVIISCCFLILRLCPNSYRTLLFVQAFVPERCLFSIRLHQWKWFSVYS